MDSDFPMRMAGQALRPYVNPGQGCAKRLKNIRQNPKGGMSHGPQLIKSYV